MIDRRPIVTLHAVSSLDGFIAKPDNTVAWLESPGDVYEAGISHEDAARAEPPETIDCFVLGSHTYEHALELGWPYGETPTIVLTSRDLGSTRDNVEFYSGDLERLIHEVLAPRFTTIWLVGGAIASQRFLALDLVDEIQLTLAPVLLGDGLRLFGPGEEQRWRLKKVLAYTTGFVELTYDKT
ncbi:MAG: dihydrofolate reductase family protein [Acidobacteriota bacterium]